MASPNETFTELVTSTLRKHKTELADNVSNHNAVWRRLNKKGRVEMADGGYEIVEPLEYAENSTFQRYSGLEVLNISESDVLSAAKFDWKQAAVHIVASGRELRINSGKSAMIKLAKSRMKNGFNTFRNKMSEDFYSAGLLSNQINGTQALVADAGTGTVGGINSSTHTFWQNIVQSAASPLQGGGAITPGSSTIKSLMNPLWLDLVRGGDKPDLIVFSNDYFTFYWESLQDLQRYADEAEAGAGFQTLKYVSADVVHDGGSGIPDAHGYFLNTEYLRLVVHKDANMTELDEKQSVSQDGVVIPIIWMGNLVTSNRSLQGVLKA